MRFTTLIILFVLFVSGCSFGQKVEVKKENKSKVITKEKVENEDSKKEAYNYDNFILLGCRLGRDDKDIYRIRILTEADRYDHADDFETGPVYFNSDADIKRGYKKVEKVENIDAESFELIEEKDYLCYAKDKNKVFYLKKGGLETVSVTKITGADIKSFEVYDFNFYSRDKDFVYYGSKKILDADPDTFEIVEEPYPLNLGKNLSKKTKDKNSIFFLGKKIENSDAKSFSFVGNTKSVSYAKDKNQAYFFDEGEYVYYPFDGEKNAYFIIKEADPNTFSTFKKESYIYGKDKESVFYRDKKILGVDLNSFEILTFYFSKDKNKVYFKEEIIEDADSSTFKWVGSTYFKDKNNVFYLNKFIDPGPVSVKKVEEVDIKTFKLVDDCSYTAKDKNYVYDRGKIIKGADPFGFRCD